MLSFALGLSASAAITLLAACGTPTTAKPSTSVKQTTSVDLLNVADAAEPAR